MRDHFGPAWNEFGLAEEPEQHGEDEAEADAFFVPCQVAHFFVFALDYLPGDVLVLDASSDLGEISRMKRELEGVL